ncbi:hypothetical protein [Fodinibius sp. Rm-B-1B1-1]|uniref:hypothetical protein n=1 Tax=Fodinibius alkaliphilus TaxID=3140241 RepID=UPI00315AF698
MNLGITTSFIIGGLLLLAMLQLNNSMLKNSAEITMDLNDQSHIETIRKIVAHDFSRIGLGKNSKIKAFNPPHFINFSADVYDEGTAEVIWHFKENVQVKSTSNPSDRILQRNGPIDTSGGSKPSRFQVVDFSITGYSDIQGTTVTTDKNEIKSLRIKVICESPEPVSKNGGQTYYTKAAWEKLIVPNNLQVENLNK